MKVKYIGKRDVDVPNSYKIFMDVLPGKIYEVLSVENGWRCTTVCPQGLLPQMMADAVHVNDMDRYENKLHGLECIQCGSCSYICPARQPLTQIFKRTKAEILARKRAQSGR